ncbi:MAG TPA: type II toxin-antitoxin system VapC family toxin [Blastocatellia bacterium]|nr:type II toxin-antitoxin system VapC family toxin [Blastocatellia bacterium]
MSLSQVILDTDILSTLMRRNPDVIAKSRAYLVQYGQLTISIITRYEILRGLRAKGASQQEARFEQFCEKNEILSITDEVIVQAAAIYADLYKRGELIGDADILIAATALVNGFGVVTNNEDHFRRITGLHVENWHK